MTKARPLRFSREVEELLAENPSYRELAEAVVEDYVRRLKRMDELTRHSTMTEAKAIELGRKARKGIHRRIMQG